MNPVTTFLLALGLSADAFAVAIGKGSRLRRPHPAEAFRVGAIFGLMEMIMPLIGYAAGTLASDYVGMVDHWIAFIILGCLGIRMVKESRSDERDVAKPRRHKLQAILIAGLGSSIDALAVGVTLAFMQTNIWVAAAAIGFTSFVAATAGMFIGRFAGKTMGKTAELWGGLLLIAIGCFILVEHMGA